MEVINPESSMNPTSCEIIGYGEPMIANDKFLYLLSWVHEHEIPPSPGHHLHTGECKCTLFVYNILARMWKKLKVEAGQPMPCAENTHLGTTKTYLVAAGVMQGVMLLPVTRKPEASPWIQLAQSGDIPENPKSLPGGSMMQHMNNPDKFYLYRNSDPVYSLTVDALQRTAVWDCVENRNSHPENMDEDDEEEDQAVLYANKVITVGRNKLSERADNDLHRRYKYVHEFDLDSRMWKTDVALPDTNHGWPCYREGHALVHHQHMLYLIAGTCKDLEDQDFDDIWQLNLQTKQYTKMPFQLHKELQSFSAAVSPQGRLWIFGGFTRDWLSTYGEHGRNWEREITSDDLISVWLTPAPLRHLAMQRLQQMQPLLRQHTSQDLAAYGIPTDIIQCIKDCDAQFL